MNLIRKILCKLKWHDEESKYCDIRPILVCRFYEDGWLPLPTVPGFVKTCKHCKNERVEKI